jgi:streptogramin lyase
VDGIFDLGAESPRYLTVGPDNNVWMTLSGGTNDVAMIDANGVITEYDDPEFNNPIGIASDGTNLWVTQLNEVVSFPPGDPTNATATTIVDIGDARAITLGPDGNLWAGSNDNVLKIPPGAPATYDKFNVPGMGARGISASAEFIYVADLNGGRIIRVTPLGATTPIDVGEDFGPQEVAASPLTEQVAYGNTAPPQVVGLINGTTATPTPAPGVDPFGMTYGADEAWWIAQFASNNLGRLTATGAYTTLALPAASGPRQIAAGPNNTLWVGLETTNQVARITGLEPPVDPPTDPPETTIDKAPKKLEAGKKGAKAKFKFSSATAGATFECSLKRKGKRNAREQKLAQYADCESPKTYKKLRKGKYKFGVRASAGGQTDTTPATAKFKVKRR